MACCFKPKFGVPEGDPETWSKKDVKSWFAHENLKYTDQFKDVDGKKLVETSRAEWDVMLGPGQSSVLWVAINQLQQAKKPLAIVPEQGPVNPDGNPDAVDSDDVVVSATTTSPLKASSKLDTQADSGTSIHKAHLPDEHLQGEREQLEFTDRVTGESGLASGPHLMDAPTKAAPLESADGKDTAADKEASVDEVRKVFGAFASFGYAEPQTEMDNTKLMKLVRECGLLDSKCTSVDVDLFFIKAKPAKRRITFAQFLDVMASCAEKKGVATRELLQAIVAKGSPDCSGTKAQTVRLYDDKSTYTGVAKQGGPTTVDDAHDLATILDRGSNRRSTGGRIPPKIPAAPGSAAPFGAQVPVSKAVRRSTTSSGGNQPSEGTFSAPELQAMFEAFASFGGGKQASTGDMDSSRFAKLCRDCDITNAVTADIVFMQHVKKGHNKITFTDFKACLEQISREKGVEAPELERMVIASGGPLVNASCA